MSFSPAPPPTLDLAEQLVGDFLAAGCKPQRLVGVELEMIPFVKTTGRRAPYEGADGVNTLMMSHGEQHGLEVKRHGNSVLKVTTPRGITSLEHGAQIELSTPVAEHIGGLQRLLAAQLEELLAADVGDRLLLLAIGSDPVSSIYELEEHPPGGLIVPFSRKTGIHALKMPLMTAAIHVSLDYNSFADLEEKLEVSMAASPIISSMLANSPYYRGEITDEASYRRWILSRCDQRRTCLPHDVGKLTVERYIQFVCAMPLIYFSPSPSRFEDAQGMSFADVYRIHGRDVAQTNVLGALRQVWADCRIKNVLELRAADSCPPAYVLACAAFWVGLLYDDEARKRARDYLRDRVGRNARTFYDQALALTEIAYGGLVNRGYGEEDFILPLRVVAEQQSVPADALMARWNRVTADNIHDFLATNALRSGCVGGKMPS